MSLVSVKNWIGPLGLRMFFIFILARLYVYGDPEIRSNQLVVGDVSL